MVPFLFFGIFAVIMSAGVQCNDSCESTVCGPNSRCKEGNNSAICACLPGYTGNPPDCQLGCTINRDCGVGLACFNGHCKNPCELDVCGLNAECSVEQHSPICKCIPGYTGNPLRECSDVQIIKESAVCISEKCGKNEVCVKEKGRDACQCLPGYYRSISFGCVQCETKFYCHSNQTCSDYKCVDPCPGNCGPNEDCYIFEHKASCRPKNSSPKCSSNNDCSSDQACDGYKCIDPCQDLCENRNTDCTVVNHEPTCTCKPGHYGSPYRACFENGRVE